MATYFGERKGGSSRLRVEVTPPSSKKPCHAYAAVQNEAPSEKIASSRCRKKTVIRKADVEKVKNRLEEIWKDSPENAPFTDKDEEPLWGPVVLCDKMTWEDFSQSINVYEGDVRRWLFEPHEDDKKCGRVLIQSLPSSIHEKTAGKILQMINQEVQTAGNSIPLIQTIKVAASPKCRLGHRRGKEPDMSLSPAGLAIGGDILDDGDGSPFPNIVIEVAFKNEPLDPVPGSHSVGLREVIQNWLSPQTSVQVVIGIKVFTRQKRRYRAILAVRNAPAWQEVEFGNVDHSGKCIGAGPITLEFPLALLYHGVPLPPALANHVNATITIDLISLRNYLNTIPLV
jgi:hypothetical protein